MLSLLFYSAFQWISKNNIWIKNIEKGQASISTSIEKRVGLCGPTSLDSHLNFNFFFIKDI